MATGIQNVNATRTKALVVPREHGAWGLLLVPLVTGACVGFLRGNGLGGLVLFATAALALFWLRTPLEILLGSSIIRTHNARERRVVLQSVLGLAICAAIPLFVLLRGERRNGLLIVAAIAGAAFAVQAIVKKFGRIWRMPAQIIGAIGLTSTAAGAYYVVTGRLGPTAISLWALNWFFAGDQIHYVHVRLHGAKLLEAGRRFQRGWVFLVGQFAMLAAVGLLSDRHLVPFATMLAFLPVTIRGLAWVFRKNEGLDLQWLGITELLQSVTFGVLLIMSFHLQR